MSDLKAVAKETALRAAYSSAHGSPEDWGGCEIDESCCGEMGAQLLPIILSALERVSREANHDGDAAARIAELEQILSDAEFDTKLGVALALKRAIKALHAAELERQEQREDEDAACRLEWLRVHFGLPEGTPEEVAGYVSMILDGQLEALERCWSAQAEADRRAEAGEQRIRELEEQIDVMEAGREKAEARWEQRLKEAREALVRCHSVMQEAHGLLDPEKYPAWSARAEAELLPCNDGTCPVLAGDAPNGSSE